MSCNDNEQVVIDILNNQVALDSPCYHCTDVNTYRGYDDNSPLTHCGPIDHAAEFKDCEWCDNKRFILTDAGEGIMDLIKRHK